MKKKHLKEIQRISKSIPKDLLDRLMKKELVTETSLEIMRKALANPEEVAHLVSPEELAKYKALLDSGKGNIEIEVVDPEVEKLIDEYLEREFEKSRKLGYLPPPQKMPKLKTKSKKIYANIKEDSKTI